MARAVPWWQLFVRGQEYGPFSTEQVVEALEQGLARDTPVRPFGSERWLEFDAIPNFENARRRPDAGGTSAVLEALARPVAQRWFLSQSGLVSGPYDAAALRAMIEERRALPWSDLLCAEGAATWVPIEEHAVFGAAVRALGLRSEETKVLRDARPAAVERARGPAQQRTRDERADDDDNDDAAALRAALARPVEAAPAGRDAFDDEVDTNVLAEERPAAAPTPASKPKVRRWYVARDADIDGPWPLEKLRDAVEEGALRAQHLLCELGTQQWVPAGVVRELAELFPPPVPLAAATKPASPTPAPAGVASAPSAVSAPAVVSTNLAATRDGNASLPSAHISSGATIASPTSPMLEHTVALENRAPMLVAQPVHKPSAPTRLLAHLPKTTRGRVLLGVTPLALLIGAAGVSILRNNDSPSSTATPSEISSTVPIDAPPIVLPVSADSGASTDVVSDVPDASARRTGYQSMPSGAHSYWASDSVQWIEQQCPTNMWSIFQRVTLGSNEFERSENETRRAGFQTQIRSQVFALEIPFRASITGYNFRTSELSLRFNSIGECRDQSIENQIQTLARLDVSTPDISFIPGTRAQRIRLEDSPDLAVALAGRRNWDVRGSCDVLGAPTENTRRYISIWNTATTFRIRLSQDRARVITSEVAEDPSRISAFVLLKMTSGVRGFNRLDVIWDRDIGQVNCARHTNFGSGVMVNIIGSAIFFNRELISENLPTEISAPQPSATPAIMAQPRPTTTRRPATNPLDIGGEY